MKEIRTGGKEDVMFCLNIQMTRKRRLLLKLREKIQNNPLILPSGLHTNYGIVLNPFMQFNAVIEIKFNKMIQQYKIDIIDSIFIQLQGS